MRMPNGGLQAKKFNRFQFNQSSAPQNTLYTVINVASGTGVLNSLNFYHGGNLDRLDFILTVDGVATTIVGVDNISGGGFVVSAKDSPSPTQFIFLNVNIPFNTSLKVEIRNNNASAANIGCYTQYNLV